MNHSRLSDFGRRHLASSGVDVYTAVGGGVGALYGPLHGGANEAVLRMLARIKTVDNIPAFIAGVKNRKEKLFGFGHRCTFFHNPPSLLMHTHNLICRCCFPLCGCIARRFLGGAAQRVHSLPVRLSCETKLGSGRLLSWSHF